VAPHLGYTVVGTSRVSGLKLAMRHFFVGLKLHYSQHRDPGVAFTKAGSGLKEGNLTIQNDNATISENSLTR